MKSKYISIVSAFMTFVATDAAASGKLLDAVVAGDVAAVNAELAAGADANFATRCMSAIGGGNGCTVLHHAAHWGHAEIAKILIDAGADPNASSLMGLHPIMAAIIARKGNLDVVETLVEAGAETDMAYGEWKMGALQQSILVHETDIAAYLISQSVDLIAPDKVGDPALHGAIYQKDERILRLLLEAQVDPAFNNDSGLNAFQFANRWGRADFALPILREYHPDFCENNPCEN